MRSASGIAVYDAAIASVAAFLSTLVDLAFASALAGATCLAGSAAAKLAATTIDNAAPANRITRPHAIAGRSLADRNSGATDPGRTGTLCPPHRAARGRRPRPGSAQARACAGDRRGRARRA